MTEKFRSDQQATETAQPGMGSAPGPRPAYGRKALFGAVSNACPSHFGVDAEFGRTQPRPLCQPEVLPAVPGKPGLSRTCCQQYPLFVWRLAPPSGPPPAVILTEVLGILLLPQIVIEPHRWSRRVSPALCFPLLVIGLPAALSNPSQPSRAGRRLLWESPRVPAPSPHYR